MEGKPPAGVEIGHGPKYGLVAVFFGSVNYFQAF